MVHKQLSRHVLLPNVFIMPAGCAGAGAWRLISDSTRERMRGNYNLQLHLVRRSRTYADTTHYSGK